MEPHRAPAVLVVVLTGDGEVSEKQSEKEENWGHEKECRALTSNLLC